jgi:hypothetical protein
LYSLHDLSEAGILPYRIERRISERKPACDRLAFIHRSLELGKSALIVTGAEERPYAAEVHHPYGVRHVYQCIANRSGS